MVDMSTSVESSPAPRRLDRLVAWVLDPDGVMYGDERERLRYYESSTFVATLQGLLVPWTLVVCALVGGLRVAPVVVTIAVVTYVPWLLGATYVRRRRVRTTPAHFSRTWIVASVLVVLPYPLLLVVMAAQYAAENPGSAARGFVGGTIGGLAGGLVMAVVLLVRKRRAEHGPAATGDDTTDDDA